jgi:hypothetical protein
MSDFNVCGALCTYMNSNTYFNAVQSLIEAVCGGQKQNINLINEAITFAREGVSVLSAAQQAALRRKAVTVAAQLGRSDIIQSVISAAPDEERAELWRQSVWRAGISRDFAYAHGLAQAAQGAGHEKSVIEAIERLRPGGCAPETAAYLSAYFP